MNFTCISNIPAFFRTVSACRGDVFFVDGKGNRRDLKGIASRADELEFLTNGGALRELEVHASMLEDRKRLFRLMQEMGHEG